jgi:hypothetical protein
MMMIMKIGHEYEAGTVQTVSLEGGKKKGD